MAKKGSDVVDIPVQFGGVSIGDQTARLGVSIDRKVLNLNAADEAFCGHRLNGRLVLGGDGDQPGQATIVDDLHETLEGVFDCKRIGVNAKAITTGLTFSLADIDVRELAKFSRGSGRLQVASIEVLPADAADEDEEEMREPPGALRAEGPWRDYLLSNLFEGALLKALKKAGLETVGQLSDYTSTGEQRLTDIDGIGPSKADAIESRMIQFWEDNPQE